MVKLSYLRVFSARVESKIFPLTKNPAAGPPLGEPKKGRSALATGLIRLPGIMLFVKGVRLVIAPVVALKVPVSGS